MCSLGWARVQIAIATYLSKLNRIFRILKSEIPLDCRLQYWIADYTNWITLQIAEKRVICNRQNLRTRTPRFPIIFQITGGLQNGPQNGPILTKITVFGPQNGNILIKMAPSL